MIGGDGLEMDDRSDGFSDATDPYFVWFCMCFFFIFVFFCFVFVIYHEKKSKGCVFSFRYFAIFANNQKKSKGTNY